MEVYIHGAAAISPQPSWGATDLGQPVIYEGNKLQCIEPDYSEWMDVKQLRRMSRIMKMGVAPALLALKNAGVIKPDGIVTGTGWGCLDDTGIFLNRITANKEEALNPTPFMQSTHNTVGAHLAYLLQCQGYNQTYSQGGFSFENALLDAMLQLSETPAQTVLAGGVDEVTEASHAIQSRFGVFKPTSTGNMEILRTNTRGTLHGEGSAWFVLSGKPHVNQIKIAGVKTIYRDMATIQRHIDELLSGCGTIDEKVDMVLLGKSGDTSTDGVTGRLFSRRFQHSSVGVFKHLCGEYPVASSFALWLANLILTSGKIPPAVMEKEEKRTVNTILIYNRYFKDHHSLMVLTKE